MLYGGFVLYFNEHDPLAAAWLRELYPGATVDERSIADVRGADCDQHDHVALFAGIGGWQYALELAEWNSARPVWTGSCPCQPFSVAGKGRGVADERHLWPEMRRLIEECCPPVVFGEQVASRAGREWLAGVRADLEALGYAVGCADLCAASVGAPHIRQRLFWVANADQGSATCGLAHAEHAERRAEYQVDRRSHGRTRLGGGRATRGMGNSDLSRSQGRSLDAREHADERAPWSPMSVIECADGKARRVEPRIQPLVAGLPRAMVRGSDPNAPIDANATAEARTMRLRGYGNAIVPQLAATFIRAFLDIEHSGLNFSDI